MLAHCTLDSYNIGLNKEREHNVLLIKQLHDCISYFYCDANYARKLSKSVLLSVFICEGHFSQYQKFFYWYK